ncbi:MAG: LLM class flavin-dependent oxidoreductase [Gammaproteobacteria bacterium]
MVPRNGLVTYSTCPPSNKADLATYVDDVVRIAGWSEEAGCDGILVYTDNGLVDPWLMAQVIMQNTERLCPLVAVQPVYMHPYSVAKMVSTLGVVHGRATHMNMVAGGFKNDLLALNDQTEHDRRYDRLAEYTTIITELLKENNAVTFEGEFYQVRNLKLQPSLPPELFPTITMSGSSEAGLACAQAIDAVAVQYPKPVADYEKEAVDPSLATGIRIGIIAREDSDEAWQIAYERFPADRKGQITHQIAMKVSDSSWHTQLSQLAKLASGEDNPYWLVPFENYKTFCPYLVGSYDRVGQEVARYFGLGYRTVILDVPSSPEDMRHIGRVFDLAHELVLQ